MTPEEKQFVEKVKSECEGSLATFSCIPQLISIIEAQEKEIERVKKYLELWII